MIENIQGEVMACGDEHVVIQLGGLGIKVNAPKPYCRQLHPGEKIYFHTYLVVREDAWSLYGFESEYERDFFILLLGVNGIGPRSALTVLSTLSVDMIRRAVLAEQADVLARVPGIGKKTAQKIVLHLQGKVGEAGPISEAVAMMDIDAEVLDALTSLGYSIVEAQTAIQSIPRDASRDVEERLRIALQFFSS